MKHILTTFAFGNGPYCRVIDLALSLNDELIRCGNDPYSVIIPLVYGDRQRRIILESWGDRLEKNPNELLLDATQGQLLHKIFYKGKDYGQSLGNFVKYQTEVEDLIKRHLDKKFTVENIFGERIQVDGRDIEIELNHNPRISVGISNSYYTSIAFFSDILTRAMKIPNIQLDKTIALKAIKIAKQIESNQRLRFIPKPSVFSFQDNQTSSYSYVSIPPFIHAPAPNHKKILPSIYVLISGIEELSSIYNKADKLGFRLYGSTKLGNNIQLTITTPDIVSNKNIRFMFARTGWSALWLAILTNTPFISPPYSKKDDPEIYFNLLTLEKLKLGIIHNESRDASNTLKSASTLMKYRIPFLRKLREEFGTLDGIDFTAKKIAEDLEQL
ncbi:hypothetical protein JYT44_03055 [Caldithrix abyssi]|nr:hypothetical protein [Caldithrix abyssi]